MGNWKYQRKGHGKLWNFKSPKEYKPFLAGRRVTSKKVPHEWLATLGEYNRTNNRKNTPNPQNNSNC